MSVALPRPAAASSPVFKAVRLAGDADPPVVSPVAAQMARLESELRTQPEAELTKYSRRLRALTLMGGAAGGWALVIAAVAAVMHLNS